MNVYIGKYLCVYMLKSSFPNGKECRNPDCVFREIQLGNSNFCPRCGAPAKDKSIIKMIDIQLVFDELDDEESFCSIFSTDNFYVVVPNREIKESVWIEEKGEYKIPERKISNFIWREIEGVLKANGIKYIEEFGAIAFDE